MSEPPYSSLTVIPRGFFVGPGLLFLFLLQLGQGFPAPGFGCVYLHFRLGNVVLLLFHLCPFVGQNGQHLVKLFLISAEGFVPQVKQLFGLGQGKAHALAPEYELQAHPIL